MPSRVIKQPNGKLALFSSVVDHLIIYDCSYDEMYFFLTTEYRQKLPSAVAVQKIRRGLEDCLPYTHGKKGDGRDRWNSDMFLCLLNHWQDGQAREELLQVIMPECGMSTEECEQWRSRAAIEIIEE